MADISADIVERICDEAKRRGVTFADARIGESLASSILVQDMRADKLFSSAGFGLCVRVLVDHCWGFASADSVSWPQALSCLDEALGLARASARFVEEKVEITTPQPFVDAVRSVGRMAPDDLSSAEKVRRVLAFEAAGRRTASDKIVNSIVSYSDGCQTETLANTLGTRIRTETCRSVLGCQIVVADGRQTQRAMEYEAIVGGPELLLDTPDEELGIKAANKALGLLKAKKCPAGKFTVIFHPSITGLLVHEALGHNAEADAVWAGQSMLEGRLGEMLAAPGVTIIDDSTIPGAYGSFRYDSEGTPGQKRVIIQDGQLVGFLHSLETAAKFGVSPNGSARADGYESKPIVRMSNTFMERGTVPLQEMIAGLDRGIYLEDGHWGYVFVQKGQFICNAGQARMIENGRLGEPLRDVSISSMTLDTLKNIDAVGGDFEMNMPGMCGKEGQRAPTDAGGPHVRVRDIVVGGHQM
jgi:TldD protein